MLKQSIHRELFLYKSGYIEGVFMNTGFVMIPEMIKSPSTAIIISEDKKQLPIVVEEVCTALMNN